MGGFDPLMLAYTQKSRWLKEEHHNLVFSKNGFVHNVILIDGMAQAIWKIDKDVLKITRFEKINVEIEDIVNEFLDTNKLLNCEHVVYTD